MKTETVNEDVDNAAARALDMAVAGTEHRLGGTARKKLLSIARHHVSHDGEDAAYHRLSAIVTDPAFAGRLAADNKIDPPTLAPTRPPNRRLTELFFDARAGDKEALAELQRLIGHGVNL